MFIRWQSRKLKKAKFGRGRDGGDTSWTAILAEAERVDGRPVQRHIAYLGSITDSAINLPTPAQRVFFYDRILEELAALKLAPAQRKAILAAIAKKVPAVTAADRRQVVKNRKALGL
ncbi:MAG: hypothetical protein GEU95_20535 [Rhizobiales bacterium]|nr:hypothetical protein [Hyphomicrobiales bacterium]